MATAVNIEINAKDKATAVISGMVKSVGGGLSSLSVMGGNLAAQGVSMAIGSIKELAMSAIDMGGKLTDASLKTGIGAKQLQIFWDAAKMAGMEADSFDAMVVKMNKNLASGAAADSLKELGMSAKDLSGKGPAQQFEMIGAALADVKDQGAKTKLAMDIFGKSGSDVFAMLGSSSEEFSANLADSEKNVRPMSDSVVSYLDRMGDSMDRAKQNAVAMVGEGIAYAASAIGSMMGPAMDFARQKLADIQAFLQENSGAMQMLGAVGMWLGNTIVSAFQAIYAVGKFAIGSVVDFGRINFENLVEIGFWLYENFTTIFKNIPQLAWIAFKTIGSIVGGVFMDIIHGNLMGIGDTIKKSMSDAKGEMSQLGLTALELKNPLGTIGKNVDQLGTDMMGINTNGLSDMVDLAKKGVSGMEAAGAGKKAAPGPIEAKLDKEKKAKAELAGLYQAGSADAYDMLAKAGSLNTAPVSAGMATTAYLSSPAAGGDLAMGSTAPAKLDQVIGQLQQLNGTMGKLRTA